MQVTEEGNGGGGISLIDFLWREGEERGHVSVREGR
jgi:hypothetical protein